MPRVSESLSLYSLIENIRAANEAVSQSLFFGDFGSAFDPVFGFISLADSLIDPVVPSLVWLIIGSLVDSVIGSFCVVVSVLYIPFLAFIFIY